MSLAELMQDLHSTIRNVTFDCINNALGTLSFQWGGMAIIRRRHQWRRIELCSYYWLY